MTSESAKIRQLLDLLEGPKGPLKPLLLNEGWVDTLKSKLFGNKDPDPRELGEQERQKLSNLLLDQWDKWLGQTDRQGSLNDMLRFMSHRIGFKDQDMDAVIARAGILPKDEIPEVPAGPDQAPAKAPSEPEEEPAEDPAEEPAGEEPAATPPSEAEPVGKANPNLVRAPRPGFGKKKAPLRSVGSGVTPPASESINERDGDTAVEDKILTDQQVEDIMRAAAGIINDEYLYNGPENDKAAAAAKADADDGRRINGRPVSLGQNQGGAKGKGQYDSSEANALLDHLGVTAGVRANLVRKVKQAESLTDFTGKDKENLFLIGLAMLRART